jgi:nitrite reductase/ring-hydroxylating ferredoxin subunit
MQGFEKVAETTEITQGSMKIVKVGGVEVLVANVDGSFYAINNKCTHVGGPLGRGTLTNNIVQCPWHGSKFDVKTGAVVGGPAQKPEPSYEVKVDGSGIWVKSPS